MMSQEWKTEPLPKRYVGAMPDGFFRKLTVEEEASFRQWARANFKAGDRVDPCWYPVVRGECALIDLEGGGK